MSAPVTLADACPACQPGVPDASPALTSEPVNGGALTTHQCEACGTAWETFWRDGWPVDRLIAPVAPDDAEIHRGVLTEALDEQDREARYAVA
jgi:hypothetical protein